MKAGRPIPRPSARSPGRDRAVLPSLVTEKLAVYETLRKHGWSEIKLEKQSAQAPHTKNVHLKSKFVIGFRLTNLGQLPELNKEDHR
jgi:hypothetical protein